MHSFQFILKRFLIVACYITDLSEKQRNGQMDNILKPQQVWLYTVEHKNVAVSITLSSLKS